MNSKIKKIFCGALCSIVLVGSLVTTGIRNTFNVKAESPRKVKKCNYVNWRWDEHRSYNACKMV